MEIESSIKENLKQNYSCLENLENKSGQIKEILNHLITARNNRKTIFAMGNGGSGSTSSHFVSDLLKTAITNDSNRFKAISLVDNIPVNLAWSNDVSYESIFSEQLKNFLIGGDIVIGFSGSGNSKNILKALKFVKNNGGYCIGFTGKSGGKMKSFSDICVKSPTEDMLAIEAQHVMLCHCIISCLRNLGTPLFKYE